MKKNVKLLLFGVPGLRHHGEPNGQNNGNLNGSYYSGLRVEL